MSALSSEYLNNFLKGSFVIKNQPYVNAAVKGKTTGPNRSQRWSVEHVQVCVYGPRDIISLKQVVHATMWSTFENQPETCQKESMFGKTKGINGFVCNERNWETKEIRGENTVTAKVTRLEEVTWQDHNAWSDTQGEIYG